MSLSKAFAQQPRALILGEMLGLLLVIGVLDFFTSYQFRLLPFYAVPIFVMAWFGGARMGVLAGLLSALIWWCANWFNGDPELRSWIWAWEMSRHLGSFLVVAWLASTLRAKSDMAAARIALLEHSERLEREIVNITDSEQRRIGQDLHDGLCQYLAALGCSAASLHEDLRELKLESEAASAGELADRLQDAVMQTRDLAHGLVPAHVAQVGLVLAIESLVNSVSQLQGIRCTFESHGATGHYDEQTATHLFRITQEAINNAIKHGKARNIAVSIEASDDVTTLKIEDDGAGFSPAQANGSGMGLNIMRYRARLNAGELKIEHRKSGGTLISCTVKTNINADETAAA